MQCHLGHGSLLHLIDPSNHLSTHAPSFKPLDYSLCTPLGPSHGAQRALRYVLPAHLRFPGFNHRHNNATLISDIQLDTDPSNNTTARSLNA
jgi:hypothetical protein